MMRKPFITAVLAAALVAAAAAPAPAYAQPAGTQSAGMGKYDAQIQQDLQKAFNKDKFKDVEYSDEDSTVTLSGTVKTLADKYDADRRAHHVGHVAGVINNIQVADAGISDQKLQEKLADKLRYDRIGYGVVFNSFTLGVKDGVATLGGSARTDMDHDSAVDIIENTPGVKDLVDNVNVLPTSVMDDDLRIRVARAIYGDPTLSQFANVPYAPIRILVDHGHVTLEGVVDTAVEKQIAGMRASSVPNVFSVKNDLYVANQQTK